MTRAARRGAQIPQASIVPTHNSSKLPRVGVDESCLCSQLDSRLSQAIDHSLHHRRDPEMCEYLTGVAGIVKLKHTFTPNLIFISNCHQKNTFFAPLSGPNKMKSTSIEREMAGAELYACVWVYLCF